MRFNGTTLEEQDRDRLAGQLDRVKTLMLDGEWRSLAVISSAVHGSEAGVSARLRDLRKHWFGGYVVERRRVLGGLFEYRVLRPDGYQNTTGGQSALFPALTHMPERVR